MPQSRRHDRFGPLVALSAMAVLAGCGASPDEKAANTSVASVSFTGIGNPGDGGGAGENAQVMTVSTPGFSARLNVPGVNLGGADTDVGGIRLHPGTRTTALSVSGAAGDGSGGESRGSVDLRFVDPAAPGAVLAYYRDAARAAGWREVPPAAGQQFAATKAAPGAGEAGQSLAITIGAQGAGSTGRMRVTGG